MVAFGRTQTDPLWSDTSSSFFRPPLKFLSPAPDTCMCHGRSRGARLTHIHWSLRLRSHSTHCYCFWWQLAKHQLLCWFAFWIYWFCLSSENLVPLNCVSDYTGDVYVWEGEKRIIFNTRWGWILIQMSRGNQIIFSTNKICFDVTIELKIRSQRRLLRAHVEQRKGPTMPRWPYCPL